MGAHVPFWPRMMKRATACAYLDLSAAEMEREIAPGRLTGEGTFVTYNGCATGTRSPTGSHDNMRNVQSEQYLRRAPRSRLAH